jgi:glycosyltransferase involved in cell wall biosynthesis
MNILYLTYEYLPTFGGVQRSVHNLAAEFMRRGHRIVIAANGKRPFVFHRQPPAPVLPLRIPSPFPRYRWQKPGIGVLDGVNLTVLAGLCLRKRIEVVHCHLINVDTRYALALKHLLGVRVVITLRGGEFHHWIAGRPLRQVYVRRMLESADAVTALSRSQLDDARALAPMLSHDSLVIPNPADPGAIRRLAAAGEPAAGRRVPYILFSGRLVPEKRVDLLIQAYHASIRQGMEFPYDLALAGDGSLAAELREQGRSGAGAGRIHFLGVRRYEDSLALVRDAAMLVLPSQESEGCPNVVLEAMALGTPVVVSDHGPLPELVAHGVHGEVFPRGDAAALRRCLLSVAESAERRSRYADAGLRYLEERHRFDRIATAYEDLYRRMR